MIKIKIKLTSETDIFVDVYTSSKFLPEHLIVGSWNASRFSLKHYTNFYLTEQGLHKSKILFNVGDSGVNYYCMLDNNKFEIERNK